jgi:hypothetical protein
MAIQPDPIRFKRSTAPQRGGSPQLALAQPLAATPYCLSAT